MFFTILNRYGNFPPDTKSQVFITWDDWNDYSFLTYYGIFYVDENSTKIDLGNIKIGYFGQQEHERKLNINDSFDVLPDIFFSVGLDDNYYETLNNLGEGIRDKILIGLKDIAKNPEIFQKAIEEPVTKISFLRGLSSTTITGQYRRLANGGVRLTKYDFEFIAPLINENSPPMRLSFSVQPDSNPPTNIHIIIGRNGVGKTNLIHNMINELTHHNKLELNGRFVWNDENEIKSFANLICITFSAFDEFDHPPEQKDQSIGIQYSYIGLKDIQDSIDLTNPTNNPTLLKDEFVKSFYSFKKSSSKMNRWKIAINILESDPIFKEANINQLIDTDIEDIENISSQLFNRLSSGHKIVLLTITRLVETLQERSLVLIDEPECHLHPPLLSSYIRALSILLTNRNGVGIIVTHSPVILQEVPQKCVWKLRRSGYVAAAERLEIESFGENVGILTQEVFGLEVTESGFYTILKNITKNVGTYEEALFQLNNNIGLEGKAILKNMFYLKDKKNENNP